MNEHSISIIIAAKNAEKTIEKCLLSILNLDYPDYELIVVDDGSQDGTAGILRHYAERMKIIAHPESQGPAKARNDAARQAKSEFIAFTDADCVVDKNWLKELLEGLRECPEAVSCGGRQEIPGDESRFGRKVAKFMQRAGFITDYMRKAKMSFKDVEHNPSCNVIYRREPFLKAGGFLAGLWPGEDVELDSRLKKKGYKLIFNPLAIVYHYRPENLNSFLKMMFRYGWAQGILLRRYGILRKIQALPALILVIVFGLFLSFFSVALKGILLISLLLIALYFEFNIFVFFLALLAFVYWNAGFYKGVISS